MGYLHHFSSLKLFYTNKFMVSAHFLCLTIALFLLALSFLSKRKLGFTPYYVVKKNWDDFIWALQIKWNQNASSTKSTLDDNVLQMGSESLSWICSDVKDICRVKTRLLNSAFNLWCFMHLLHFHTDQHSL